MSSAEATEKAAAAPHRVRAAVLRQHSGHSGAKPTDTVDQPWRPVASSGCTQPPSAGGDFTVVWNVIVRSRNICNVKSMLLGPPGAENHTAGGVQDKQQVKKGFIRAYYWIKAWA